MKRTVLTGIIALTFMMASSQTPLWAATEVATPDLPSNFLDATKWPRIHTESCMPAGKEYRTTAYARIIDGKKIEYVLTSSLSGTIFRYEYAKGGGHPDFVIDFIKSKNGWMRFNHMKEDIKDQFENYLVENKIPPLSVETFCANTPLGFEKFWHELFNEIGVK